MHWKWLSRQRCDRRQEFATATAATAVAERAEAVIDLLQALLIEFRMG
jgi:hypothetical protein